MRGAREPLCALFSGGVRQLFDGRRPRAAQGAQRELNQSFARIAALAGVWTAFPFAISLPADERVALTVARWVYVFAAFVLPAFFSLLLCIGGGTRSRGDRLTLRVFFVLSTLFAALAFSPSFMYGVRREGPFFAVEPGPLYACFVAFMALASTHNFVYCLKAFTRSVGSKRHQLKCILLGFGLAHRGAILHFVAAYLNWEPFPHDLLLIALAGIITYAIVQHRLMDITLVLNRGIVYVLLLGMLLVPTYLVSAIHQRLTVFSLSMLVIRTLALACAL